jgi:hypothetical protein
MKLSVSGVVGVLAACLIFAAISVYGMNFFAGRGLAPTTSVFTQSPLELKLELGKIEFLQGESINITVSLKNIGTTSLTIFLPSVPARVFYEVYDLNGTEVHWDQMMQAQMTEQFILEPNEQVSRTFTWDQLSYIYKPEYYHKNVPKGTYTIVGTTDRNLYVDGVHIGRLETPPITITIK